MPNEVGSIAVVGAAGLVGRELLRQFEDRGIKVTAVIRTHRELAVDGEFHDAVSGAEVASRTFDLVINLAYPTSGAGFEQVDQNEAIIKTVRGLVSDGGRLIQVSTIAVFGMAFDRPPVVGPVERVRDVPYVETKIAAEHAFTADQEARGLSLDIVRLGNVWGYASGAWAVPVTQRLLTGRPLGVLGAPAFSNTTDVANVADYLVHLAEHGDRDVSTRYHHLAEFSSVRWPEWINPIAEAMDIEPVFASPGALNGPDSLSAEVRDALAPVKVRRVYQTLAQERASGSLLRSAIRQLPSNVQRKLRSPLVFASEPPMDRAEQTFQGIMSAGQEFTTSVRPDWQPQVDRAASLNRVLEWLERG